MKKPWNKFAIERAVVTSKAFSHLSGKAPQIYLLFHLKLRVERVLPKRPKQFRVVNNGLLQFTYKEAKTYGYTTRQFTHAIDQLVNHGFIDITRRGANHFPTLYALSERWARWATPEYEEQHRSKDISMGKLESMHRARAKRAPCGTREDTNINVGDCRSTTTFDVIGDMQEVYGKMPELVHQHKCWRFTPPEKSAERPITNINVGHISNIKVGGQIP